MKKMNQLKKLFTSLIIFTVVLIPAIVSAVSFSDQNWKVTGPGSTSITPNKQDQSAKLSYSLKSNDVWKGQTWEYSTTSNTTETIKCNFKYTYNHAGYNVIAQVKAFTNGPTGKSYVKLYDNKVSSLGILSGKFELTVKKGYSYGFVVYGKNYDSNNILTGDLTVIAEPTDATAPVITPSISGTLGNNGWYITEVLLNWAINDLESPITSILGNDSIKIKEDIKETTYTCTAESAGGKDSKSVAIKKDSTAPVISGSPSELVNSYGWYNTEVTVRFNATDDYSGLETLTRDVSLVGEGSNQTATGSARDLAGNSSTATVSGINIDKTKPKIIGSILEKPKASGWYNSDVTVHFDATDELSGLSTPKSGDVYIKDEAVDASAIWNATDKAGNIATETISGIKIDKTAPKITGNITDKANSNGWYNKDVTVTFLAVDNYSKVAEGEIGSVVVNGEGKDLFADWSATDNAGNIGTDKVSGIKIDRTGPVITSNIAIKPNDKGWYNGDIRVRFSAVDALSGIKTGKLGYVQVKGEGDKLFATWTATDKAGNTVNSLLENIKIDKTAPNVSVVLPKKSYTTLDKLTMDYSAEDTLSGIASLVVTLNGKSVAKGQVIDLALMSGENTIVIEAKDNAGNSKKETVKFNVAIASTVDVTTETLNLKNSAIKNPLIAYIELPVGVDASIIDKTSVKLNIDGTIIDAQVDQKAIGDYDSDGISDLMVKFERAKIVPALEGKTGNILMVVTGNLINSSTFEGSDTVNVMNY